MEKKAAEERAAIAESVEEVKLQADENKNEILEAAESNTDAIITNIHGADAAAAGRDAELKADFEEKVNEIKAENQGNFDSLEEKVDEGKKGILHEVKTGFASTKKDRQEETSQQTNDILSGIKELFKETETGKARRRADDLEIKNRQLEEENRQLRAASRKLFPEKEEESKPKVPSTPILSTQNRANLPPSAAARSFAASEKHVLSTRKENERKERAAEAASKPAPLPPVAPTPRRSSRTPRPTKRG